MYSDKICNRNQKKNSLTPFHTTDVPYKSCTGTSAYPLTCYITLAYVLHAYIHTYTH